MGKKEKLNPNFMLSNFKVGPSNELAHAAAVALAQTGALYNPFFVYGKFGTGKTHLLQGTMNLIKKVNKTQRVCYVTAEKYCNCLIKAITDGKGWEFRESFKKYDALAVDDVDVLSGREKTQEAFWDLVNYFCEAEKPILLASDQLPSFIEFTDKLRAHCDSGLMVGI